MTATDVDENDTLTYSLTGGSGAFEIDQASGQIMVTSGTTFVIATKPTYTVTVTATDEDGERVDIKVTITVTAGPVRPPIIITGGGGGGGGGPSPSTIDFEWTVKQDIEAFDDGHGAPTGLWGDGATLWVLQNGDGADDAVYAYDLESGERLAEREFELAETNRAPRGFWSDGLTVWVSDSGRDRLFAYDLASGDHLTERDIELAEGNADARGIWSDGETMWVLDDRANAVFAYDLEAGALLAEYALDSSNRSPRGIWSDGVTLWVSDPGSSPRRLFAYRLPTREKAEAAGEDAGLERVREEEFSELSRASNNSPRGIWANDDVMYVVDESDDKLYTYNMPDAIDARLASLTLSGIDIGAFSSSTTEYEAVVGEGVAQTTVEATSVQRRTEVAIHPTDGNEANGHQVSLQGVSEVTVTVTSADGNRTRVYRVTVQRPEVELVLAPTWTSIEWPGADGTPIVDALRDGDIADKVVVVYHWDEATAAWLAFFPGLEDVPGLNTLTTLEQGRAYWIAVTEPLTWTLENRAPDER